MSLGNRNIALLLLISVPLASGAAWAADALPAVRDDAPLSWTFPATTPLCVHVVRGLWSREYRIEEALARAGAGGLTESWHAQGIAFGYVGGWDPKVAGSVPEFPETAEDLLASHVLIICNVNALAFTPAQQNLIRDYVKNGGGVLLLGGRFAFGSQWNKTPLAEIAPVTFVNEGFDLKLAEKGLVLAGGPDPVRRGIIVPIGVAAPAVRWENSPRVFWYHAVKPRAGARVALTADGQPMLIAGSFGKGRVALFAGSVMGDPPAGALPFWESDQWPRFLAGTIAWLADGQRDTNGKLDDAAQMRLGAELAKLTAAGDEVEAIALLKKIEPLLVRSAKLCRDPQTAEMIVNSLAGCEADPSPATAELLARRLAAPLGARGAPLAAKLIASGKLEKTVLGLPLLGMSKADKAGETLLRFLASGELTKPIARPPVEGELPSIKVVRPEEIEAVAVPVRQAAMEGLAYLGDPATLAAIHRVIESASKSGHLALFARDDEVEPYRITAEARLYQTGLIAALKCGDAGAGPPLAEALLGNVYTASRARSGYRDPGKVSKGEQATVPPVLAWQAEMVELVRLLSDDQVAPLAAPIAAVNDIRIVPTALAAFGGRTLPPAVKTALRKSKIAAVASLGE